MNNIWASYVCITGVSPIEFSGPTFEQLSIARKEARGRSEISAAEKCFTLAG